MACTLETKEKMMKRVEEVKVNNILIVQTGSYTET